ncbi:hypothetical protein FHS43_000578 [Streptosporangium becharense]|uniref:Uncharacterized protein n=1 Tax=Streptosporangium becharense TaxID=1816182 RepID=A0A7W9MK54_9ACTN|nr:hypothetical protein [Streptosporangium becharense]MBB2909332.1 hypothetical protein [Streptosporangium becharense]MBB5823765.1 hypothetical protein [Streptosporangium becharense]
MPHVLKLMDEFVNNSTTLQADDHLRFIPEPWSVYEVTFKIKYDSPTGADLKIGFTLPDSCRFDFFAHGPNVSASADTALRTGTFEWSAGGGSSATFGGLGPNASLWIRGLLFVEDTIGDFGLQWAQATATVGNSRVRYMSYMTYQYLEGNPGY